MFFQSILIHSKDTPSFEDVVSIISKHYPSFELADHFYNLIINQDKSIGIETVNELHDWNSKRVEKGSKIAVIFKSYLLTAVAQNALLKVIEEPSQNTLLVLITNNTDSIIETIRSRTKFISMKNEETKENFEEIKNLLQKSFAERALFFSSLTNKERIEQLSFLSSLYSYLNSKQEYELLETLLTLQRAVKSQVQSNLIFDSLNIALNDINFRV